MLCEGLGAKPQNAFDEDCQSLCKLVGTCDHQKTFCKTNGRCEGFHNFGKGICSRRGDESCSKGKPVACRKARKLNPDKACARLDPSSYCKVSLDGSVRLCHGIGSTTQGDPCPIGSSNCFESHPFSCDKAIHLLSRKKTV